MQIGRQIIDIELERIGAGLLNLASIVNPAADRDAVETANDRNVHSPFGIVYVAQIGIGADVVARHIGKITQRLGEALRANIEIVVKQMALPLNLFFK